MPSNIEIKARVRDFHRACEVAERISGQSPQIIVQRDTFFPCAHGRLKVREFSEASGELITYTRPDTSGAKQSDYLICPTSTPATLKATLAAALGTSAIVTKKRRLYLIGQTRIHLDEVEGLGTFLELEVVLRDGQSAEDGRAIARQLVQALDVSDDDLLSGAYADMLANRHG